MSALALGLLSIDAAQANDGARDYDADYTACLGSMGATNNSSVAQCSEKILLSAKAELNTIYDRVHEQIAKRSVDDANRFERAQKAWLLYRNGTCELAASYVGSPMASYCPMRITIQRVKEMREFLP